MLHLLLLKHIKQMQVPNQFDNWYVSEMELLMSKIDKYFHLCRWNYILESILYNTNNFMTNYLLSLLTAYKVAYERPIPIQRFLWLLPVKGILLWEAATNYPIFRQSDEVDKNKVSHLSWSNLSALEWGANHSIIWALKW